MEQPFSLQENFDQIDDIIKKLEDLETPFENTVALYEKGIKLIQESETYLKTMTEKIKMLTDEDEETEVDF